MLAIPMPVAFESRKLTAAERTYPPHMLELLAVVHALRTFRHYLLPQGGPRPAGETHDFELHTDNQSIVWLQGQRTVSHHQARWLYSRRVQVYGGARPRQPQQV